MKSYKRINVVGASGSGNYNRATAIKWKSVELVVWLDYSFSRTFFQSLIRALKRVINQKELWPGTNNRESLWKTFFSKKSILLWVIKTHPMMAKRYESASQDSQYSHIEFVRLRNHRESKEFLKKLEYDLI